jgi:hypothetical protein
MEHEECPICGINVKVANMPRHLRRVHPHDEAGKNYAREVEKELPKKKSPRAPMSPGAKKVAIALAIIVILVTSIGLVSALYFNLDHPRIEVNPNSHDFGTIQQGVVTTSFEILNFGEANLELKGISTSCGCTSAVVKFRGTTSPVFGMHNNPKDWSMVLLPGDTATLEVTYDSGLHPDVGQVHRVVYIKTNDPLVPEARVDIWANVIQ